MQLNSNGWHVDDHIVVAVSTGIDSMCLLYQLLKDYKDSYRKLTCLHVNHGVRSASIEEARFLEAYCERHHIDLHIKSWICRIVSIEITAFRMKLELNVTNGLMK